MLTPTSGGRFIPIATEPIHSLSAGHYNLQMKAPGFETYTNDQLRFDVVFKMGQVAQQVEVTTSEVHVEAVSTQLGDVIKSQGMEALPLNGCMFTDLLGLQPGVIPGSTQASQINFFGSAEQGNVSINRQRESANGFQINGSNDQFG